jgi:hypothetical protein
MAIFWIPISTEILIENISLRWGCWAICCRILVELESKFLFKFLKKSFDAN